MVDTRARLRNTNYERVFELAFILIIMRQSMASFNSYRQARPKRATILAKGKFYPADAKGNYPLDARPFKLILCREYLWVSETFSIPLDMIRKTEITKHGGGILFWDSVSKTEEWFYFTKVGILFFRRREVERLLTLIDQLRVSALLDARTNPSCPVVDAATDNKSRSDGVSCEVCGRADSVVFTFQTLEFIGVVPLAWSYKLTPMRYLLCKDHSRRQLIRSCAYTAFWGSLGFPGLLAAPYYVLKNLWKVHRVGFADAPVVLLCILGCVILPWVTIAAIVASIGYCFSSR